MRYFIGMGLSVFLLTGCGIHKSVEQRFVRNWQQIQVCSSLTAPQFPHITVVPTLDGGFNGKYYLKGKRIVISKYTARRLPKVVQHEMLHYLLDRNNLDYTHNNPLFNKCTKGT